VLTTKQIKKSARLMSQVGEHRPGFIDSDASFLKGPEINFGSIKDGDISSEGIVYKRTIIQDS